MRPAAALERLAERRIFPWPLSGEAGLLAAARSLCETLGTKPALEGWTVGQAFLSGDLLAGGSWRWARRLRFPAGSAMALYAALQAGLSAQDGKGRSPRLTGELTDLTLTVADLSPQRGFQAGLEQAVGESRVRSISVSGVERLAPLDTASPLPERRWLLGAGRRPLTQPAVAVVECRQGRPWRVGFGRCPGDWRGVAAVADCWELEADWWQPEPVARRYWALAPTDGGLVTVFQDRLSGSWLRHGGAGGIMSSAVTNGDYVELRGHSWYSFGAGASAVSELVGQAAAFGYPALGLTDVSNLCGTLEFAQQSLAAGFQPIVGVDLSRRENSGAIVPATLLAATGAGYANLCRLTSLAYARGGRQSPVLEAGFLEMHAAGVIALLGASGSVLADLTERRQWAAAEELLQSHISWLGRDSVFVAVQRHGLMGIGTEIGRFPS